MRQIFLLQCTKCKYEKTVIIGTGDKQDELTERTKTMTAAGAYGDDMRRFYADHPGSKVIVEQTLYRCNRCSFLEELPHLQLVHKDASFTLRHKCRECNCRMAPVFDINTAVCPKCKKPLHVTEVSASGEPEDQK